MLAHWGEINGGMHGVLDRRSESLARWGLVSQFHSRVLCPTDKASNGAFHIHFSPKKTILGLFYTFFFFFFLVLQRKLSCHLDWTGPPIKSSYLAVCVWKMLTERSGAFSVFGDKHRLKIFTKVSWNIVFLRDVFLLSECSLGSSALILG